MITKTNESLSNVFDVVPHKETPLSVPEAIVENPNKDLESDLLIARTTIQALLVRGADVLENAILIANGTEDPKFFDATANMIGKLTDASERLVGLHEKKNKASLKIQEVQHQPASGGNIISSGPVFVGSTTEFAKMISDSKKSL